MSTRFVGDRIIVGELPKDWTFVPMQFPTATPFSVWKAKIKRIVKYGKMLVNHTYVETKTSLEYAELEFWYYCEKEQEQRGLKVWRLHK